MCLLLLGQRRGVVYLAPNQYYSKPNNDARWVLGGFEAKKPALCVFQRCWLYSRSASAKVVDKPPNQVDCANLDEPWDVESSVVSPLALPGNQIRWFCSIQGCPGLKNSDTSRKSKERREKETKNNPQKPTEEISEI